MKVITPKSHGGVTALAFISSYLVLNPNHMVFSNKLVPFFIIPATIYMYEFFEA